MTALPTVFCTEKRAADLGGAETVYQRAAKEWGPSATVLVFTSDAVPDGMRVVGRVAAHRTGPAFRVVLPIALERWCPCGEGRNRPLCRACRLIAHGAECSCVFCADDRGVPAL